MEDEELEKETQAEKASEKWAKKFRERNPERKYDDDPEEFYNELDAYDSEQNGRIGKYEENDKKMKDLMLSNPELGGIFNDIASGKHPAIAFIEHFGDGIVGLKDDPELSKQMVDAQNAYMDKLSSSKKVEQEQNANMEDSRKVFADFVSEKKMSEDESSNFFDKIIQSIDDVFMCRYSQELLDMFYKGMNYENDIASAAEIGEVNGKNQKIRAEVKKNVGDGLPKFSGEVSTQKPAYNGVPLERGGFFETAKKKK